MWCGQFNMGFSLGAVMKIDELELGVEEPESPKAPNPVLMAIIAVILYILFVLWLVL